MLTVVIVINLLISLLCLSVAWRVWKLRRQLATVADILRAAERSTQRVLHQAPNFVHQRQSGIHGLRERSQQLELQLQKIKQVLILLGLAQGVWRSLVMRSSLRLTFEKNKGKQKYRSAKPLHKNAKIAETGRSDRYL
ncbi:hypothetical protein [Lyngbya aestuarii]|uniref:hypothetical protein n=1 Tax=Lyngbya aestuarii TaxID=118322 RepID=UPI00403D9674